MNSESGSSPLVGTPGRLAILVWTVALVTLVPQRVWLPACAIAAAINLMLYPQAPRRLLSWRWLVFAVLILAPSMLWGGEPSHTVGGIALSRDGFLAAIRMLARALTVVLAVNGFAGAVDISEVAWLFERAGMSGLGFSLGVAVNLLPALSRSSQIAWHSLRMRGGLRARWWRGLRLLLVTIVANALKRGEEIALAAEVRAFSVEKSRPGPMTVGQADLVLGVVLAALLVGAFLLA